MKTTAYLIDKRALVRIFKEFQSHPKKVFVAKDFNFRSSTTLRSNYLHTLIRMGLIEEVKVLYKWGIKYCSIRGDVKGYKLKNGSLIELKGGKKKE